MTLTPPKRITFYISVILGLLGFLGVILPLSFVSTYAFWFAFIGLLLLVLGLLVKDL